MMSVYNMMNDTETNKPTLTLDPMTHLFSTEILTDKTPAQLVKSESVPEMELTPEEQKMVNDFAEKIDLTNTQMVLQYGAGSQKKIADFSENALVPLKQRIWMKSENYLLGW